MRRNLNKATESPQGSAACACVCPSPRPPTPPNPPHSSGMAKLSITASSASPQGCRQVTAGEKCNKKKKRVEDGRGPLLFTASCTSAGWLDWPGGQSDRKQKQKKKQFCYQGWIKFEHVVLTRHTRHFRSVSLLCLTFKAAFGLRSCHRFNKVLEKHSRRNLGLGVRARHDVNNVATVAADLSTTPISESWWLRRPFEFQWTRCHVQGSSLRWFQALWRGALHCCCCCCWLRERYTSSLSC